MSPLNFRGKMKKEFNPFGGTLSFSSLCAEMGQLLKILKQTRPEGIV